METKIMKNDAYSRKPHQWMHIIGALMICPLLLAGCKSIPAPTDQIAASKSAVNDALSAGGNEYAPLPLKSAIEKMEAAERAMGKEDYELAKRLAEQAQIDAQLAGAMARSTKAQKAAEALQESSRVLRQEIDRQAP